MIDRINAAGGGVDHRRLRPATGLRISSAAAGADLTRGRGAAPGWTAHDLGIYRSTGRAPASPATASAALLTPHHAAGGPGRPGRASTWPAGCIDHQRRQERSRSSFAGDKTVDDLLNRINTAGLGVLARINAAGTGIDIVNTLSGSEMRIGENGGTTAEDLGVRSLRADDALRTSTSGAGVTRSGRRRTSDHRPRRPQLRGRHRLGHDGRRRDRPDQRRRDGRGRAVTADLARVGNGIELTDATGGAGALRVEALNGSTAAGRPGAGRRVSTAAC